MDLKPVEINQLHKDWTISFLFLVFPCTYKSAILSKIAVETTLDSQTGCLLQTFRRSRPCMFLEWLLNATEDLGINLTVNTSMSIDRGVSLSWLFVAVYMLLMRSIRFLNFTGYLWAMSKIRCTIFLIIDSFEYLVYLLSYEFCH